MRAIPFKKNPYKHFDNPILPFWLSKRFRPTIWNKKAEVISINDIIIAERICDPEIPNNNPTAKATAMIITMIGIHFLSNTFLSKLIIQYTKVLHKKLRVTDTKGK